MLHALAPLVWMLWSNSGSRYSFNSADITVPFCGLFAFPVTEVLMRLTDFMATAKRDSAQSPLWWRLLAAVTGAGLTMLQDLTRLWSKLVNGRIYQLFLHFDWMDGQEEHLETIRLSRACGNVASLLLNDILRRGGTTLIMGTCQDASWTMAVEIVAWVAMLSIWCAEHRNQW